MGSGPMEGEMYWAGCDRPRRPGGHLLQHPVQPSAVLGSIHRLVIQILRVLGLGKKYPALGDQRGRLQHRR